MYIFFIFLAVLLAINVWATRHVMAAPDDLGIPKRMLIAAIWIAPFMGALTAKIHTPGKFPAENQRVKVTTPDDEAPLVLEVSGVKLPVAEHLIVANGVPILDWGALGAWANAHIPSDFASIAMDRARHAWLLHFRDALGPEAYLHISDSAYILSTLEPLDVKAIARYVSTTRDKIKHVLGDLARFPSQERSILVVLDSQEDYYHYVSIYYPEGEFALSGGMFINAGCPHFVVVRDELLNIEPVIAHELTHSAVTHLRLPKWLDEGLAVNTERKIAGSRGLLYTPHELDSMHRRFWNNETIQEFWSGRSFDRADDGNLLSYDLARIVVEQVARNWDQFAQFVVAAKVEDAGASSAQTNLGLQLGAYAAALFGSEATKSWEPNSLFWEKAADA